MFPFDTYMEDKLIYIVDDDKVILHLLEYTFKSRGGYEIKTFLSCEELLESFERMPDLIVLDHLFNEKKTGLETLKEIRKRYPDLPVIILTGEDSAILRNEFLKNGAKEFINKKDYFIDTLIESVEDTFPN
jgi:DNA-binding NtrC family response regulator